MTTTSEPRCVDWTLIFRPAIESASAAMQSWTSGVMTLALDEVQEVALEELSGALDLGDELATMVVMGVAGQIGGQLILVFDDENATALVRSLLNRPGACQNGWGPLERSALQETGNILSSAYLNAITRVTGRRLLPSPPHVVQDYGSSVVENAIMTQAIDGDRVLLCRTRFERLGQRVEWNMYFVPSHELLEMLRTALVEQTLVGG